MVSLGLQFRLAVTGDLERYFAEELAATEVAVTRAMGRAGVGLKTDLRGQTVRAGLGERLAKTWRDAVYPKKGASLAAAAAVWSKAPHIARAHAEATVIKSKSGFWLAIPTENAPRAGVGRKRITPSNFPEHALGKLRFVPIRGQRRALLVVDGLRRRKGKRGGFAKATAAARRRGDFEDSVVMFVLVPEVRLRRRLDVEGAAARWERQIPALILEEMRAAETRGAR